MAEITDEEIEQVVSEFCSNLEGYRRALKEIAEHFMRKGMQLEREKVLGVIESLNSIGYPYGGDYKYAIQQALR